MINVLVLGSAATYNYGNFMMLINFIEYFSNEANEEVAYYVYLATESDFARLKEATGNRYVILSLQHNYFVKKSNPLKKFFQMIQDYRSKERVIKENQFDAVIVLGGDNLSEYYSGAKVAYYLFQIRQLAKKVPCFLLGQTIGPFNSWRKSFAHFCFTPAKVYSRDLWTFNYLRETIGLTDVHHAGDLAFLNLPQQSKEGASEVLAQYALRPDEYVAVIPSGKYQAYAGDYDVYIKRLLEMISYIASEPRLAEKKIVLLAHVISRHSGLATDEDIINTLQSRLPDNVKKRTVTITEAVQPIVARCILGHAVFSLSGRMHGAISTYQMRKPSIALSYSVKYQGVIGDELKRRDLIIEAANHAIWRDGSVVEAVREKISYLLDNMETITTEISERMRVIEEKALWQITETARAIDKDE